MTAARPALDRAVVTGGAGFIGSHLVDRLLESGCAVLVIDDLSTGTESNLAPDVSIERLDIATDRLGPTLASWRPNVVFHLAAQASVPVSIAEPLRDLAVNVVGTHRVALAARQAGARLVFTSSGGAIYGESTTPADEETRAVPASYYGVHKLAAEGHVALAGLPYAIARPSNVYGPRQRAGLDGAVIAAFVDQAQRTGGVRIHGDGLQTRDFVHVTDVVSALLLLGRTDTPSGTWNIAAGRTTTILELAAIVERALDRPLRREHSSARIGDVRHSGLDAGRLREMGWRPTIELEAGVDRLLRAPVVDVGPA